MQISNRYSFIHYAVPKTASQSSWKTFRKYVDIVGVDEKDSLLYHHTTPSEDLPEFETHFKFCFVRNPWDKIVSHYFFSGKDYESFEKFIEEHVYVRKSNCDMCTSQHEWYTKVDYIARYENYENELKKIFSMVGIEDEPVINKINITNHKYYREYYTDRSSTIVYDKYKKDIDDLGYEYD